MVSPPFISVVVPVLNEEESLALLYEEIRGTLDGPRMPAGARWELLFVDDHSTDSSLSRMLELRDGDRRVRVIRFRRNFGQTAALSAGFEHARGQSLGRDRLLGAAGRRRASPLVPRLPGAR